MFRNAVLLPKSTLMLANKDPGFPGSSAGKESACNAGDPGSISQSGRSPGEGVGYPLQYSWASLVTQLVKNLPGDLGSIPGLGRPPGEGNGYTFQYSDLENSMDCIVHGVTKSQTRQSDFHLLINGNFLGLQLHYSLNPL